MVSDINIIRVEEDGPDGIIVTFSDRTFGAYVVEEILELRPHRETVQVESAPAVLAKKAGVYRAASLRSDGRGGEEIRRWAVPRNRSEDFTAREVTVPGLRSPDAGTARTVRGL
jgi:hypothetical protein